MTTIRVDLTFDQVFAIACGLHTEAAQQIHAAELIEQRIKNRETLGLTEEQVKAFGPIASDLRIEATKALRLANDLKVEAHRSGDRRYDNFVKRA